MTDERTISNINFANMLNFRIYKDQFTTTKNYIYKNTTIATTILKQKLMATYIDMYIHIYIFIFKEIMA